MKLNLFTMTALVVIATGVSAKAIECKNINEATDQGYSVRIAKKAAYVSNKGVPESKLKLVKSSKISGSQVVQKIYSESKLGGMTLILSQGGVTGVATATLTRNGVVGETAVANLNDCRK